MAITTDPVVQPIITRPLVGDEDFWRVHKLLTETAPLTPPCFNWDIRRWEGKRFYEEDPERHFRLAGRVQLWETTAGRLVGVVNPEGEGDAHLQIHPAFRDLEPAMIDWAEAHLAYPTKESAQRQVEIFVYDYDTLRQQLLAARGYTKMPHGGVVRRLRFAEQTTCLPAPIAMKMGRGADRLPTLKRSALPESASLFSHQTREEAVIAAGYTLRTTHPEDLADCQKIADLLNAAFNRNFHNALEYQNFTKLAPSFRNDLDLVAVAPDGSFAAYVGVPYDEANRRGIFEPVCTHPDHRRRGLARTLMLEGLRRLCALGAVDVTVDTGDMIPANCLYDSIGFTEVHKGSVWQKVFCDGN